jgi:uncharacterized protein (DUF1810 family)
VHHELVSEGSGVERFVRAQDAGGTFEQALVELRAGRKRGHSMTLFAAADPGQPVFAAVLDRYLEGVGDPLTLGMLGDGPES